MIEFINFLKSIQGTSGANAAVVRGAEHSKHLYPNPLVKNSISTVIINDDVPRRGKEAQQHQTSKIGLNSGNKTPLAANPDEDERQGRVFCADRPVGHYSDPTRVTCSRWLYCDGAGRHEWFWCPRGTYFHQQAKACDFYDKRVCLADGKGSASGRHGQATVAESNEAVIGDTYERVSRELDSGAADDLGEGKDAGRGALSEEKPPKAAGRKPKK
jgi:hypothetical protein